MKLRAITENIRGSNTAIRQAGAALGDLIAYLYTTLRGSNEQRAMDAFLQSPSPAEWQNASWLLDSTIKKVMQQPEMQHRAEQWADLKQLTSPTIAAALYDVEPQKVRNTPFKNLALSRQNRDKMKRAVGPLGFISTFSGQSNIPKTRLRDMMKNMANSSRGLVDAAKHDLDNVKPIPRF